MHPRLLKMGAVAMLMLVLGGGWVATMIRSEMERALVISPTPQYHTIAAGSSFTNVARELGDRGILSQPRLVSLYARWNGQADAIKAGEYEIQSGRSVQELLDLFVSGRVVQHPLTLVEGWSFEQMLEAIRQDSRLQHTLDGLDDAEIMQRLGRPEVHPEGRFLADTYHFPRGTTDVAFLRRAMVAMSTHLEQQWHARDPELPYASTEDVLIMASIIEKETGRADERARIAGVFVRRLEKGMRLETDPTVIYGLGDEFDGNLRRRDLRADTPYNTYLHRGLPPTPIAMSRTRRDIRGAAPSRGNRTLFRRQGRRQSPVLHHLRRAPKGGGSLPARARSRRRRTDGRLRQDAGTLHHGGRARGCRQVESDRCHRGMPEGSWAVSDNHPGAGRDRSRRGDSRPAARSIEP